MNAASGFPFQNSYSELPDRFYSRLAPVPVRSPRLIKFNRALAEELGLSLSDDAEELASIFSGNLPPNGSEPLAMAYAGHQFGGWSPQLGDGRAILLGEVCARDGLRYDIQLKGSGRTPWSRGGDGRAWLGPVLREYVISEAMAALGVPTTRALAAVTTGEVVLREEPLPGAIVTRVAASHIRVGTFQYFAAREDHEALELLLNYAIDRHYPEVQIAENKALSFLDCVVTAQAQLIAKWMGLGFIHGVMNTDNCTISGETIDFGPCAFMDDYHPAKVFSSIDHQGRYAYGNQPRLAHWNLAQLASALLPLIDTDDEKAVALATASIDKFVDVYQSEWSRVFGAKTGVGDVKIIQNLLTAMEADKADFTNTFRSLSGLIEQGNFGASSPALNAWLPEWRKALSDVSADDLDAANPAVIPRNHQIESMIVQAREGDFSHFEHLLDTLSRPYNTPEDRALTLPPEPHEVVHATYCGT